MLRVCAVTRSQPAVGTARTCTVISSVGTQPDTPRLNTAGGSASTTSSRASGSGWVPTLEMTVHVRAVPTAGWLRVTAHTRNLAGGYLEEDAEVWDSADRLVAQSRQLARRTDR